MNEAQATAALDQCTNTLAALQLGYDMLRCTHASMTLLQQMSALIDLAREELDLSDE